jgi:hypothetical protein
VKIKNAYENIEFTIEQEERILDKISANLEKAEPRNNITKTKIFKTVLPAVACVAVIITAFISVPNLFNKNIKSELENVPAKVATTDTVKPVEEAENFSAMGDDEGAFQEYIENDISDDSTAVADEEVVLESETPASADSSESSDSVDGDDVVEDEDDHYILTEVVPDSSYADGSAPTKRDTKEFAPADDPPVPTTGGGEISSDDSVEGEGIISEDSASEGIVNSEDTMATSGDAEVASGDVVIPTDDVAEAESAVDEEISGEDIDVYEEIDKYSEIKPQAGMLRGSKIDDFADMAHFREYLGEYQSFWDFPSDYYTLAQRDTSPKSALDLMFVIDTTGSMSDELSYLQAELANVIQRVKDTNSQIPVNLSVNFYRDEGDQYVVKSNPFTDDIKSAIGVLNAENCDGGGDFEEAVEQALYNAIEEHSWSKDNSTARLLFMVLDAPPHSTAEVNKQMRELVLSAQSKGIVILPVAASGIDRDTERLLRQLAVVTGGTYQFLTNNSHGIGGDHLTPTDIQYEVLPLNDLLVDIINSYV